jgi:hypothetical protein
LVVRGESDEVASCTEDIDELSSGLRVGKL